MALTIEGMTQSNHRQVYNVYIARKAKHATGQSII